MKWGKASRTEFCTLIFLKQYSKYYFIINNLNIMENENPEQQVTPTKSKGEASPLVVSILVSVAAAMIVSYFVVSVKAPSGLQAAAVNDHIEAYLNSRTEEQLIADFYHVETAAHVSPHGYRKHIADGSSILVDLRSQEEYETAHVITAINIPAYATPDKSDYGAVDRIVGAFQELKDNNPGKDIIVYCYSMPCMTGRKIGKMLADNGIYVKHLGVGWSEWRYFWKLWNHDGETPVNPSDYVWSGPEPGVFKGESDPGCPLGGEFGC